MGKTGEVQTVFTESYLNDLFKKAMESQSLLMISFVECDADDFEEIYLFNGLQLTEEVARKEYREFQLSFNEEMGKEEVPFQSWMASKGYQCERLQYPRIKPFGYLYNSLEAIAN